MSQLPTFIPGQRLRGIPGGSLQQIVDAVDDLQGFTEMDVDNLKAIARPWQMLVPVKNESGSDLDPLRVLGFKSLLDDTTTLDAAVNDLELTGELPDADAHGPRILVVQDAVGDDDSEQACFLGLTFVQVDIKAESDTTAGLITGDTAKLESGKPGADIWWKEKAEDPTPANRLGVQWCLVLIGGSTSGLTIRTQYAVVTTAAGDGTWSGSPSLDFRVCPGTLGKCVLLHELGEPPTYPSNWASSTAYDADEKFSAAVGGGLTDPEDNAGNALIPGETYTMSYPTGQTSGSSLDVTELAKMQTHARQHGAEDAECLAVPILEDGETMADYEMDLQCLYDEVGLSVGKVIKVSNTSGAAIPVGPYSEGEPPTVIGEFLQPTDYLRLLSGYAPERFLWSTDDDRIVWETFEIGGYQCVDLTYVVSVACADGEIVYETSEATVLACPDEEVPP